MGEVSVNTYEIRALEAIERWEQRESSRLFEGARRLLSKPVDLVVDKMLGTPVVGTALEKAVQAVTALASKAAHSSLQEEKIYAAFRTAGYPIGKPGDVFRLPLQNVDGVAAGLQAKYIAIAAAEGAGTGLVGLAGLAADIPAMTVLSIRAAAEYAVTYGFSLSRAEERAFLQKVLTTGFATSQREKAGALIQLRQLSKLLLEATSSTAAKALTQASTQTVAKALATSLARRKLAQFIPLAGAVIAGTINVACMHDVCETAACAYRKRFLKIRQNREALYHVDGVDVLAPEEPDGPER